MALSLGEAGVDIGVAVCQGKAIQLTPDEITRLSPAERLRLIGQLWDSLADAELPLPPAQQAELARRLATLEQDRAQAVTWERLKAELARRCP